MKIESKKRNKEQSIDDLWEYQGQSKNGETGVPEGWQDKISEEIWAKEFPTLRKTEHITFKKLNEQKQVKHKETTPRHIINNQTAEIQ